MNAASNAKHCATPLLLPTAPAVATATTLDKACPAGDDVALKIETTFALAEDAAAEPPELGATLVALTATDALPCADAVEITAFATLPETMAAPEEFASAEIVIVTTSLNTAVVADAEDEAKIATTCAAIPVAAPAPLDAEIAPSVGSEITLVLATPVTAPTEAARAAEVPVVVDTPADAAVAPRSPPELTCVVAIAAAEPSPATICAAAPAALVMPADPPWRVTR